MAEMHPRQERRAKNESLFRNVNEQIADLRQTLVASEPTHFVCECDDLGCKDRFVLAMSEYEHVRADPTTFVVVPGHEDPSVEEVIAERKGFNIVRKHPGAPARVATEDAPR